MGAVFDVRRGGANHRPLGRYDWRRIDKMPSLLQPRMGRPAHRTAIRTGAHRSEVRHRRAGSARGARRPGHGGRKRPRDARGDRRLGIRPELPPRGLPPGRTPATRIDDRTEPPGIRKQDGQWCKSATKIDDQREPSGTRKQTGRRRKSATKIDNRREPSETRKQTGRRLQAPRRDRAWCRGRGRRGRLHRQRRR